MSSPRNDEHRAASDDVRVERTEGGVGAVRSRGIPWMGPAEVTWVSVDAWYLD